MVKKIFRNYAVVFMRRINWKFIILNQRKYEEDFLKVQDFIQIVFIKAMYDLSDAYLSDNKLV